LRLTYEGMERSRTQPRMLNETPAQLVAHLSHANGWWRDTAQQLLVLKQDKSVVPALQQLVKSSNPSTSSGQTPPSRPTAASASRPEANGGGGNLLARFHALWTLEGLGALDAATIRAQMKDASPRMRIQAIRASETLYKTGDRSFDADYRAAAVDQDVNVAIQALLTLNYLKAPSVAETVRAAQAASTARGVQEIGNQILKPPTSAFGRGGRGGPPPFSPAELAVMERGEAIYKEVCFACHGDDGRGTSLAGGPAGATMAPSLASSPRVQSHRDYVTKTLLHGMDGPIDGKTYAGGVMAPVGTNRDDWIAAIASYVRNSFGNVGSFVSAADVSRVRADTASRKTFWKIDELMASLPAPLEVLPTWKASASHNPGSALGALNFASWTTGAPQQPGMWFQVELPAPTVITEIQFNAAGSGFPGGGRGRGAPAAGAAAAPTVTPLPPAGPYPRAYKVETSINGSSWKTVAQGQGTPGATTIVFAPIEAKYVRITQTATAEDGAVWSMQRLRIYRPGTGGATR
jgi:mono/diheme cytochrome c family protein